MAGVQCAAGSTDDFFDRDLADDRFDADFRQQIALSFRTTIEGLLTFLEPVTMYGCDRHAGYPDSIQFRFQSLQLIRIGNDVHFIHRET